ncbi:MAG: peptidase S41, partial [Muribaculaceae bacterium]|nr:peptidase S41 [Muribaculaceae bacterium]
KGFENEWRKHHTSAVTRDLWRYDVATGKHTNLTAHAGEDRNPVLGADGRSMLFLSERNGGSMNVYTMPLDGSSAPKALTSFKKHPVRFLSQGADGTVALTWDGEIYTMKPGGKPSKVKIDIVSDEYDPVQMLGVTSGAHSGVPSPDGKEVAFVKRGEVFVTSVEYPTTKQITHTAAGEGELTWGADNRTLYYTSERDGRANIYKASIVRDDDPNFANATEIAEEVVLPAKDGVDRGNPKVSPDGKKLAFVQDGCRLMVMDLDSRKVRQLTDGSMNRYRAGVDYVWSPDSRWIALSMVDNLHDPYYNLGIVNVEGTPKVTNLTNTGYFDMDPLWTPDGNAVIFMSDRYGMRNHASWGSQYDVMAVFMNRDALDRFRMNEEDYKLLKDAEAKAEKEAKKADKDKKEGKDKKKDKKEESDAAGKDDKAINVELDGIEDRVVRLTPYSSDIAAAVVDADGEKLYYLSAVEKGYDLWKIDLRKGGASIVNKLDAQSGLGLATDKDAKTLFMLGSRMMKKMDMGTERIKNISYTGRMKLDRAAEREAMFNDVYRSEKERFYVADMHGVDWDALTTHYRKFLPHISNNYDFSEMLSELLGELNVSHTGSGYRGSGAEETTASLGLLYDLKHTGKGLKVAEVVKGGPLDRAASKVKAGMVVESVNGETVDGATDYTVMFNGLVGKKTLLSVYDPETGTRFDEVVVPIGQGAMNDLLYKRWVRNRAADVDRMSGGRLGYVHIQSMGDDSFRQIYADILGKYNTREGIVIDTRWNGGGRLHEDIEILFSGEKYFTQEVRGEQTCDMPSRRWNKPSIMIQGEANYSNAHGTPWVYKHRGLGKLVGMPVPGTMTSVNWITLQDPSLYFGIPVVGYRLADGSFLENQQLEPDIKIANDADVIVTGEDQQLRRAVEELLRDIDARKKK